MLAMIRNGDTTADKRLVDYLPRELQNSEQAQYIKDIPIKEIRLALSKLNFDFYGPAKTKCESSDE